MYGGADITRGFVTRGRSPPHTTLTLQLSLTDTSITGVRACVSPLRGHKLGGCISLFICALLVFTCVAGRGKTGHWATARGIRTSPRSVLRPIVSVLEFWREVVFCGDVEVTE